MTLYTGCIQYWAMPDATPLAAVTSTVSEQVYRALKRDLITLQHRPGAPLREQHLADLYGCSRVPVREACRRLQQEGLVTSIAYKGYLVSQISLKEIMDCFDLRLLLESHAVAAAARRATPGEVAELRRLAAAEYTFHDRETYLEFLDRNLRFHVRLATLGGNQRLVTLLEDLLEGMQRFFFLGLDLGDFSTEMRSEHEQLVEGLDTRDPEAVAGVLRGQITASRERILQALVRRTDDIPFE